MLQMIPVACYAHSIGLLAGLSVVFCIACRVERFADPCYSLQKEPTCALAHAKSAVHSPALRLLFLHETGAPVTFDYFLGGAIDANAEWHYAKNMGNNIYAFFDLRSGPHWLSIIFPGCQRQLLTVSLTEGEVLDLVVTIKPSHKEEATTQYGSTREGNLVQTDTKALADREQLRFRAEGLITGIEDTSLCRFACQYVPIPTDSQEARNAAVSDDGVFAFEVAESSVFLRAWAWHNKELWSMPWTVFCLEGEKAHKIALLLERTYPVIIEPIALSQRLAVRVVDRSGLLVWHSDEYADIPRRFNLVPGSYTIQSPNGRFASLPVTVSRAGQRLCLTQPR